MAREIGFSLAEAGYASEICGRFKPSAAALALLRDQMTPPVFVAALRDNGLDADAAWFLAHALPRRQAVWWASQCLRSAMKAPPPGDEAAMAACERWAVEPTEESRRTAERCARELEFATPPAVAAMAAFLSNGSISPADAPIVGPQPNLTADMAKTAVLTAAALAGPESGSLGRFLDTGTDLGRTIERWVEVAQALADEHAAESKDPERKRLKEAAIEEAGRSPAEISDKRMTEETDRALGPKRAAEEEKKKRLDAMAAERDKDEHKPA